MIIHALQMGTPFVYEIVRIGYCIRGKYTSDKYSLSHTQINVNPCLFATCNVFYISKLLKSRCEINNLKFNISKLS